MREIKLIKFSEFSDGCDGGCSQCNSREYTCVQFNLLPDASDVLEICRYIISDYEFSEKQLPIYTKAKSLIEKLS